MAASLVSTVVPASVGAADASKGFAIKTYDISKPASADAQSSITINKKDIPAGGYVLPSAVYYSEGVDNSTDSLLVSVTTDSKDISFKLYDPTESYTSDEKEYTIKGSTFKCDNYISFAGNYNKLDGYSAAGLYVFGVDSSQTAAGTDNYYIGCSWMSNGEDYAWAGDKSDSYPFYVFDTVIPQNIAAGTYTLKFCEYNTDASGKNNNPSPMVEGEKTRFTTEGKNLKLETMTIKVTEDGGDVADTATTTTAPQPTTTSTTSTTVGGQTSNADISFAFVDENGKSTVEAKAGDEITVFANVTAGGKPVSAMDVQFKASEQIKITAIGGKSAALGNKKVSSNLDEYRANFTSTGTDGEPLVPEDGKAAFTLVATIPEGTANGTYTVGFDSQCKVFKDSTKFNYETAFTPLTIKVGNGGDDVVVDPPITTTTTTAPQPTTTTTVSEPGQSSNADIKFTFADENGASKVTAQPGEDITVYANVVADGKPVSAMDVQFKASEQIKITAIGSKTTALGNKKVSTNLDEYRANFTSTGTDGEPLVPTDGKAAFTLVVTIPEGTANGTYTVGFDSQCKVFKDSTKFNYETSFVPLEITVGQVTETTTTTTTTTTTVTSTDTTTTTTVTSTDTTTSTTTTTTPPAEGDKLTPVWGDANCDGAVDVCDVVLVLTYLNDNTIDYFTAQGKVNADVNAPQAKEGAVDPKGVKIDADDQETLVKFCLKYIDKLPV